MSGTPPTRVATTGTSAAIASNSTIGVPSVRELSTNTSNARNSRPASGTAPCQTIPLSPPFVPAVLPPASGEAAGRGDGWTPELTGHAGIHDIRPIAVRVDHIRADTAAQGSHRAPLSPIGAHRQLERMGGNAAVSEGRQEGVPLRGDIQHNGDVHVMAQPVEPVRQGVSHALETTEVGWGDDLQDDHSAPRPARQPPRCARATPL